MSGILEHKPSFEFIEASFGVNTAVAVYRPILEKLFESLKTHFDTQIAKIRVDIMSVSPHAVDIDRFTVLSANLETGLDSLGDKSVRQAQMASLLLAFVSLVLLYINYSSFALVVLPMTPVLFSFSILYYGRKRYRRFLNQFGNYRDIVKAGSRFSRPPHEIESQISSELGKTREGSQTAPRRSKEIHHEEISILRMDLANFATPMQRDDRLAGAFQLFWATLKSEIERESACRRIKSEGDSFIVFSPDSGWLLIKAHYIGSQVDQFRLKNPSSLGCLRSALNRGRLSCLPDGANTDFSGDPIVVCQRLDEPMKSFVQAHKVIGNMFWCTERFKQDIESQLPNLEFSPLGEVELAKGYVSGNQFFRILFN